MLETRFYQREVRPMLIQLNVFFCRVEQFGIPDIYVAKNNISFWLELKCINKKTKIIKPQWRLGQLAWIKQQNLFGNNNIYLILKYVNKTYFLLPKEAYFESDLICLKKDFLQRLGVYYKED